MPPAQERVHDGGEYTGTGINCEHALEGIRNYLEIKLRSFQDLAADLRVFRLDNDISDEAKPRDPLPYIVGITLAAVAVETIGGALVISTSHPGGVLGAATQSFLISLINVSLGFFMGFVIIRNLFHIKTWRKWLAALVLIPFGFLAIFYNLLVAHYRANLSLAFEELGNVALKASQDAVSTFLQNPFYISNFEAWLLFGIGMLILTLACWKGIFIDDPYPGYGKADRSFTNSMENLNLACDFQEKNIEGKVDSWISKLKKIAEDAIITVSDYERHTKNFSKKTKDFRKNSEFAKDECNKLLKVHWTEYRRIQNKGEDHTLENHEFRPLKQLESQKDQDDSEHIAELNEKRVSLDEKIQFVTQKILAFEKEAMRIINTYRRTEKDKKEKILKVVAEVTEGSPNLHHIK